MQAADVCRDAVEFADRKYKQLFGSQFNSEGMHLEHSPEYHLLAVRAFNQIESTGLLRLDKEASETLKLATGNLSLLIHPDGGFAAIGDTEVQSAKGAARFDPVARWLVSGHSAGEAPAHALRLFPDSGYAIFRDEPGSGTFLLFTVAHHSRVHKHMDTGSFEWSDRGRRVLIDSGKWGYSDTKERRYVLGAEAHNVLETQGVNNSPGNIPSELPDLMGFQSRTVFGVNADIRVPRRFIDASWRRTVVGSPGEWLIVADEIREALPSTHTAWFHLAPSFSIQPLPDNRFEATLEDSSERLVIFPLQSVLGSKAFRGAKEPRMLGWYSPAYGALQPNWQIGYEAEGRTVRMATVFRWLDDERALQQMAIVPNSDVADEEYGFCWMENGQPEGVRLEFGHGEWEIATCE
jgi:hypothetical protein